MSIPKGVKAVCAADMFLYDETKAVNLPEFFKLHKDKLPMLIIIIGGNYGETRYDCYDNLQVLRVNNYTSQMRVVVDDSRNCLPSQKGVMTIPVDTLIKFRVIKGHSIRGKPQKLNEIIGENDIPFQIEMACDSHYPVKVGNTKYFAKDFDLMLVKEHYYEHFFIMNCIDGPDLKMNKDVCMACLSPQVEATPITGFRYGTQANFDELCRQLTETVKANDVEGNMYDQSLGNPDFSEYTNEEIKNLLEICEFKRGILSSESDINGLEGDYIYPEYAPALPPRDIPRPKSPVPVTPPETKHPEKHKKQTKKSTSSDTGPSDVKSPNAHDKQHKKGFLGLNITSNRKREKEQKPESIASRHNNPAYGALKGDNDLIESIRGNNTVEAPPPVERPQGGHFTTNDEKKPELPPRAIEMKLAPTTAGQTDGNTQFQINKNYQNTAMNRATVKPMVTVRSKTEEENNLKEEKPDTKIVYAREGMIKEAADEEPGEYSEPYEVLQLNEPHPKNESYLKKVILSTEKDGGIASSKIAQSASAGVQRPTHRANAALVEYETMKQPSQTERTEYTVGRAKEDETVANSITQETSEAFDIKSLSIKDLGKKLRELKLEKYIKEFEDNHIDGTILSGLTVDDYVSELGLKKLEAVRLQKFVESGHIPK